MGPVGISSGRAPNSKARWYAFCASRTLKAIPQAEGPCSWAKYQASRLGYQLIIKLISPCRYRDTSLERCLAISVKPSCSNNVSNIFGVGLANSTNSKPSNPIGLSKSSVMSSSTGNQLFYCDNFNFTLIN